MKIFYKNVIFKNVDKKYYFVCKFAFLTLECKLKTGA